MGGAARQRSEVGSSGRGVGVPQRPGASSPGGKDEQDLGRKSRGGRCPRGLIKGVFQTNTGTWSPGFVRHACVVKMHVSGAHAIDPELSRNSPTLNPEFPRRNKWGYVAPISIRKITDLSS